MTTKPKAGAGWPPPGPHNIYFKKKPDPSENYSEDPWVVYFYYVTEDAEEYPITAVYSYQKFDSAIAHSEIKSIMNGLATNATLPLLFQTPCPDANSWGRIWRRKSYLVIAVDIPGKRLNKRKTDGIGGANFVVYGTKGDNHSFFDAKDVRITITLADGKSRKVDGLIVTNHMKRDDIGTDMHPEWEKYGIQIFTTPPLKDRASQPHTLPYPDSGGTNLGPPVPPP